MRHGYDHKTQNMRGKASQQSRKKKKKVSSSLHLFIINLLRLGKIGGFLILVLLLLSVV
ncbi:hypothetical protein NGUA05_00004 [Salmonella enterica]|nr:hypothetical protein NGUA05_00004 [Salmonella enterica]